MLEIVLPIIGGSRHSCRAPLVNANNEPFSTFCYHFSEIFREGPSCIFNSNTCIFVVSWVELSFLLFLKHVSPICSSRFSFSFNFSNFLQKKKHHTVVSINMPSLPFLWHVSLHEMQMERKPSGNGWRELSEPLTVYRFPLSVHIVKRKSSL